MPTGTGKRRSVIALYYILVTAFAGPDKATAGVCQ
jgi:hypothetical protein